MLISPDASRKARHEFRKSPPGKVGFRISGDLLGCLNPPFDQLQQRHAAALQALAFLDVVDEGKRLIGQLEQHFARASLA